MQVGGARPIKYYNSDNELCDPPSDWQQLRVNAVIEARGVYFSAQGSGLQLEVTAIQYASNKFESPF